MFSSIANICSLTFEVNLMVHKDWLGIIMLIKYEKWPFSLYKFSSNFLLLLSMSEKEINAQRVVSLTFIV